jgi:hypothetical protein
MAMLTAQILLAPTVLAQGTMGSVPDPISASELDGYSRRLGLSAQQRVALEQFHEQYREAFSLLRDGEIENFLNENPLAGAGGRRGGREGRGGRQGGNVMGLMMGGVDAQAVKESIRQLESIVNKIKALDNTLFDQIQGLLTEEQSLLVPGVRQARERERYRTGVSRMTAFTNPGTTVDLSAMVANLALSPDERTNVTPLVTAYESSLTAAVRKLHDSANDATVEMAEKMEALTAQDQGGAAGQRRGGGDDRRMDGFRQVWADIMLRMNEKAVEITDLNRRTERSLNAVLAPPNARRLRSDFYNRAYPEVRGSSSVSRAFETALTFEDLTQEQRDAIVAMQDQYLGALDAINIEMADMIDEQRKTQTFFNWDDERRRAHDEKLSALREKRNGLGDSARAQASATLGPELTEQLERRVAESRERQREERSGAVITMVAPAMGAAGVAPGAVMRFEGSVDLTVAGGELNADPFVPAAITTRDLETYAGRLKLDEDQRALLAGLHSDYLDQYRMVEETQIKAVREAEQSLWSEGPEGEREPPKPEMIDNLYSLRRQAIESIKTIDGLFFENVQLALLDDGDKAGLERVQNARLRSVYNRGAGSQGMFAVGGRRGGPGGGAARFVAGGPGGGSSEATIDLSVLVEQTNVVANDASQLDAALADYEASATAAFQVMFDTSMRVRQAIDKATTQFTRGGGGRDGGGGREAIQISGDAMRNAMEADGRAAREARDTMVNLNRTTLERVTTVLEPRSADDLRQAYNRKAFPEVFRDPGSAEPRIDAALALTDLTDTQRDQIQSIAAEFHDAYATLCNQMIELERNAPAMGGPGAGGIDVQAIQERFRNREKIEFERTDLSDKMLARLRATLSPEQSQRIGLENAG